MYVCVCWYMHVCTYTYIHMRIWICMCMCMFIYIHVYTHTFTDTHTHTHTYIYIIDKKCHIMFANSTYLFISCCLSLLWMLFRDFSITSETWQDHLKFYVPYLTTLPLWVTAMNIITIFLEDTFLQYKLVTSKIPMPYIWITVLLILDQLQSRLLITVMLCNGHV